MALFQEGYEYFLYLTNWSLSITTIYCVLVCVGTIQYQYYPDSINQMIDIKIRYIYTLQQISTTLSLNVVVAFWYFIHDPINFTSINHHGVTALFNTLDLFFSKNGMDFAQTIHKPFILTILYIIFSIILGLVFDKSVYDAVDWVNYPLSTLINAIIVLFLTVIIHWLLCFAKKRLLRSENNTNPIHQQIDQFDLDPIELDHAHHHTESVQMQPL